MTGAHQKGLLTLMAATFVLFPYAGMGNNTSSPYSVVQRDDSVASIGKPVQSSELTNLSIVELVSFATLIAAGTFILTDYTNKRLREKAQNQARMDKENEHPDNEENMDEVETPPASERIESTLEEIRRLKETIVREQPMTPVSLIDHTQLQNAN